MGLQDNRIPQQRDHTLVTMIVPCGATILREEPTEEDKRRLVLLLGYLEPCFRALQRVFSVGEIIFGLALPKLFFRAPLRLLGPLYIDVLSPFRNLRQNSHFVGQYLGEAPRHSQVMRATAVTIADFAHRQLGDQRRMARQDPKISILARNLNLLGGIAHHHLFWRDDFKLESVFPVSKLASDHACVTSGTKHEVRSEAQRPFMLLLSTSRLPRAPHRSCLSYKKPARGYRRICLRQCL